MQVQRTITSRCEAQDGEDQLLSSCNHIKLRTLLYRVDEVDQCCGDEGLDKAELIRHSHKLH